MDVAKIQLSTEELSLVQNAHWLLTKNTIIEKVYALFGDIAHHNLSRFSAMRDNLNANPAILLSEVLIPSPKISRGENYGGLPWVMLDYPRLFNRQDTFAIRTLFWWGHFFSVTLHLKGQYKQQFKQNLLTNLPMLASRGFYLCISGDEWRHEFEEDNYKPLSQLNSSVVEEILLANDFCKLSAKISLPQWNRSKELIIDLYETIVTSIGH
ncbi:hypothetical protein A4H97_04340 [Niastella yeongjuensis]|uniref:Uncharacterized protein n=1 Tax=Niastella yeongjuensis TaxID=354355 RepID=A0A1V9EY34_9BACT|nr:hypothetical protein [Niastella yeongjuensis]OQP51050.1 hypothetical protein A4H97_04340 [Niastella yeongjuensis]SEN05013.1 hypothetical protein SAMN05660816_00066 [Niastella yeongjuensis]